MAGPVRDLTVRVAGMRDTLRLRSVDVTFRLNQPEALLGSRAFLSRISTQITSDRQRKPTILVAETQGELLGVAEYLPSMPDLRWQLASLGLQVVTRKRCLG